MRPSAVSAPCEAGEECVGSTVHRPLHSLIQGLATIGFVVGVCVETELWTPAWAQDVPANESAPNEEAVAERAEQASPVIEEIVVTAQKREEVARDVPIAMSVFTGDFIKDAGIADLGDLSRYAPNARFNVDYSLGPQLDVRIRGFGTATSAGSVGFDKLDQPVGLAIDGDSYSKLSPFSNGLFDIERVEILKGPQGTLFGKNTTAGLINITTKGPTDKYEGYVDGGAGSYGAKRFEGGIGGPLIKNLLNLRVSGFSEDGDGFLRNTAHTSFPATDSVVGDLDREGIRYQLEIPDFYGATFRVYQEHTEGTYIGPVTDQVQTSANPAITNWFRQYDPAAVLEQGDEKGSVFLSDSETTIRTRRLVVKGSYEIGGWTLHGLFGDSSTRTTSAGGSQTPPVFVIDFFESEFDQNTFELRLLSPALPGLLGLAELFGYSLGDTELTFGFYHDRSTFPLLVPTDLYVPQLFEFITILTTGDYPPVPPGSGVIGAQSTALTVWEALDTDDKQFAGFMHMAWTVADRFTVEPAFRVTHETKDSFSSIFFTDEASQQFFENVFNAPEVTGSGESSFTKVTPKVALTYAVTNDVNVYAAWAKGFKSGGLNFDPLVTATFPDFAPEDATSWEIGTKGLFLNGMASADLSFFWTTIEDLQLDSTFLDPVTGLTTGVHFIRNAGKARSRGADFDMTWLVTDWLTWRGSVGLADTEYEDYKLGPCTTPAFNRNPAAPGNCDLTGFSFEFTPRWVTTFGPDVRFPLFRSSPPEMLASLMGTEFFVGLSAHYEDVHKTNQALFTESRQPSFFKLDGTLGLGNPEQGWSLRVNGTNLTDEDTYLRTNVLVRRDRGVARGPAPPRMVFGSFRYAF